MVLPDVSYWGWAYLLIALRLAPLAVCLPAALLQGLPRGSRPALVVLLSLGLTPVLVSSAAPAWQPPTGSMVWLAPFRELLLGLALAVGFVMLFAGMTLAGKVISPLTGISWADAADPLGANESGTVIERFFGYWAVILFWVTNGHRHVLQTLLESFDRVPIGSQWLSDGWPQQIGELLMHSSRLGCQIAAPVAFCLVGATCAVAILGRSLSFFGLTGLGTAVSWLVLLTITAAFLPTVSQTYRQQLVAGLELVDGLCQPGGTADVGR